MYTLHGFSQSGNAFKVAFMLRALNQPWQAEHIDFFQGVTRSGDWREGTNAMGEVPVLDVVFNGETKRLTQSCAILSYLAEKHGQFGGKTADERQEVLRWLLFDNHKFTSYFATYRFNKAFAPTPPDPVIMNWLKGRMDNAFGIVDKHLSNRQFILGASPTIADFSLSGCLFYPLEESGYDFHAHFPNISAWVSRLKALPGWADPYDALPGEKLPPKW